LPLSGGQGGWFLTVPCSLFTVPSNLGAFWPLCGQTRAFRSKSSAPRRAASGLSAAIACAEQPGVRVGCRGSGGGGATGGTRSTFRARGFAPNRSKPVNKCPSNKKKGQIVYYLPFFYLSLRPKKQFHNPKQAKKGNAPGRARSRGRGTFWHASKLATPKRASVKAMTHPASACEPASASLRPQ
jgi:hypothetical protein